MSIDLEKIIQVTVSGLRVGEEDEVMALITACGLHTEDISLEKLRHFVVARKGDHAIGVVGIELSGDNSVLRSLAVAESHRGRGIAKKLIASLERYAMSHGIGTLYLLTLTGSALFAGQGYTAVDRSTAPAEIQATNEFKRLCPDTAVCMKKELSK